jgi:hypothetical protein
MHPDDLLSEFRQLGARTGDEDGQPGSFVQDGKLVLRINGRLLFVEEARAYLHELKSATRQRPESPYRCQMCDKKLSYWGSGARIDPEPEIARRLLYHCPDHESQEAVYEPMKDRWLDQRT